MVPAETKRLLPNTFPHFKIYQKALRPRLSHFLEERGKRGQKKVGEGRKRAAT